MTICTKAFRTAAWQVQIVQRRSDWLTIYRQMSLCTSEHLLLCMALQFMSGMWSCAFQGGSHEWVSLKKFMATASLGDIAKVKMWRFLSEHQDEARFMTDAEEVLNLPSMLSLLENTSNFLTAHTFLYIK